MASAVAWRVRCQWAAMTARRRSRQAIDARPLRRLLVVCYGNIHRSPYAAELLRSRIGERMQVRSSGFHAVVDRPSPPQHVERSQESGVDLRGHRSSKLTVAEVAWADMIVLMDRHNWQALCELGADTRRLVWLGALDGGGEIPDPYGVPPEEARRIMNRLHRCVEALAAAIRARESSAAG